MSYNQQSWSLELSRSKKRKEWRHMSRFGSKCSSCSSVFNPIQCQQGTEGKRGLVKCLVVNTPLRRSDTAGISHFYQHTLRSSDNGMNHTCLFLPSRSWYSLTDPGGMEVWASTTYSTIFNQQPAASRNWIHSELHLLPGACIPTSNEVRLSVIFLSHIERGRPPGKMRLRPGKMRLLQICGGGSQYLFQSCFPVSYEEPRAQTVRRHDLKGGNR